MDQLGDAPAAFPTDPYRNGMFLSRLSCSRSDRRSADSPRGPSEVIQYIRYTSGSTGRPKGVEICHRGLVNELLAFKQAPGLHAGDVWAAVTTLSFDISELEFLLPLIVGARFCIIPPEIGMDPRRLKEALKLLQPTAMQATPATWQLLLDAHWEGDPGLKVSCPRCCSFLVVVQIMCGGEALTYQLTTKLLPKVSSLWNLYGPTETTVWSHARQVTALDLEVRLLTLLFLLDHLLILCSAHTLLPRCRSASSCPM
jgi:non-ribosomal peptide synthetase component F